MPFIEPIAEQGATGEVAALYEEDRADQGYVSNSTAIFSLRPSVLAAWISLRNAITASMDRRRYELATLAAARRLRSSYCMLGHGSVLAERFYDPEAGRQIALDHRSAGLEPLDVAVMDLAEKVAADATSVTQADVDRLRDLGLADEEIFDVVATAAARSFFTKVVDALGALPDAAYAELDPALRDAFVIGRPIAPG
jgi:uncharacterized peroxidase-related enzyme